MRTGRGFERLVNFSDAVIAIAATLLVLPLVEIPTEANAGDTIWQLLADNGDQLTAFVISFLVIWALWRAHHSMMEHFRGYDAAIVRLHMVWLFTIVVLPFTTQLMSGDAFSHSAMPLYIGTLLVSSITLLAMNVHGRAKPELLEQDHPEVQRWLAEPISYFVASVMVLALIVSLVAPQFGTYTLILLVFDGPFERVLRRLRRGRRATGSAGTPASRP